jgi:hypothetical protein
MEILPGIFLEVNVIDTHPLRSLFQGNVQVTIAGKGKIVLGYLIVFGKVRVIIILPVKLVMQSNTTIQSQSNFYSILNHLLIQDGKHARESQADRAGLGIGPGAEPGAAATENFRVGGKFGMDL